jgi:hypothetical protein
MIRPLGLQEECAEAITNPIAHLLGPPSSSGRQWAVVITVVAMRMMKVAADAVVDVTAVRYGLVTAAGAVDMARLVPAAPMVRGAAVGVLA